MIEFAYPWAWCGLLALPLLGFYLLRWRRRPAVVTASAEPFRRAAVRGGRLGFPEYCYLAAAFVLVAALARPRFGDERVVVRSQGIDIVLALDLSGSMAAYDVPKGVSDGRELLREIRSGKVRNRLEVAKEEVRRFIEARPNDRIGLLGFADLAYSFAPPTLDHEWLLARLEALRPGLIGDATGIASPIGSGVARLRNSAAPRRVLVLFTDGANTAVNRLTPQQAAKAAKEFGVILHTVGIGSSNAYALVNSPLGGSRFVPAGDSFDAEMLSELASATGGSYFHAADAEGMRRVMEEINRLEKTSFEQPKYVEYREYAPRLALVALALILLGFTAETTWKLRLP